MMEDMEKKLMNRYGVNEEQLLAIDIGKNIALHAGAGSGKTRVLTRRYIRLLDEDHSCTVESIVAITFTEKAALEMKERIRAIVEQCIRSSEGENAVRWKEIKDSLSSAPISTMHSFCDSIIRENYYLLGLEPYYSIIQDVDRKVMLKRLSDEVINTMLNDGRAAGLFESLLDAYGTSFITKGKLSAIIQDLCSKIKEDGCSFKTVRENTSKNLEDAKTSITPYMEGVLGNIQALVLDMAEALEEKYSQYKRKEGLLDFNDLELFALKLLELPEIRKKYRERLKYFLVDEFQDTNELQRRILYYLVQGEDGTIIPCRLFIVGDHKQAIYGFRGTDYRIFTKVTEDIEKEGSRRELSTCYRSYPNVVDTVNQLFSKLLEPYEPLAIAPDKIKSEGPKAEVITIASRPERDPAGEAWKEGKGILKDQDDPKKVKGFLEAINTPSCPDTRADLEAMALAGKILQLKNEGFEYKDVAVLLRTRAGLASFEDALKRSAIPYCILGGIGFFDKQEVVDILNTYEMLFYPDSLTAVAAALRSPIFGIGDDRLYTVFKSLKAGCDLSGALEKTAADAEGDERRIILRASAFIKNFTALTGLYGAGDFLRLMIESLDYREILLTENQGFQKYRNIEKLMRIAREFDSKDMYHAREFIEYVSVLRQEDSQSGDATLDTEDSDAVKLLTIHASKGLEFRAVIVPGMSSSITTQSIRRMHEIAFDSALGVVAGIKRDKTNENPIYLKLQDDYRKKLIEEGKRLLYVAATRAIEYLGFLGQDCDREKLDEDKLDSFIKQVRFAQSKYSGEIASLKNVDGKCLIEEYEEHLLCINSEKDDNNRPQWHSTLEGPAGQADRIYTACPREPRDQASISRYMTFKKCKLKYFFQCKSGLSSMEFADEDGIREEQAISQGAAEEAQEKSMFSGSYKGTVVHSVLEALIKESVPREECRGIIEKVTKAYEPYNEEKCRILQDEVVRYVNNFYAAEDKLKKTITGGLVKRESELSFRMPIMEGCSIGVNGIIDRIDIYEGAGGLEGYIIDYKTNSLEGKTLQDIADSYKPQLMLYAKAFNTLYYMDGTKPSLKGVYLYLLDTGEYIKIEYTDGELAELLESLRQVFEYTSVHDNMEDYPPCPSDLCRSCKIQGLCSQ